MKESDIVAAAVAALLAGTISVDAFARAPEESLRTHLGGGIGAIHQVTIEQIVQQFEMKLAEVANKNMPQQRNRNPGNMERNMPKMEGNNPKIDGIEGMDPKMPRERGWYGCITCT